MKLLERYVLRRIVSSTLLTFISLGAMVWLSQALRQFDIVTADGQAVTTFFQISVLLVPVLVAVVFPVSLLIAVIYTFSSLNSDAELVVINASGARQGALLKPVVIVAVFSTFIVASMTLYFSPLALRTWQTLITNVRGNIISSFMTDGAFVSLTPKLVFHMRNRNQDGSLRGIFLSDDRDPAKTVTYLAEKGAILNNPLGVFLIMGNGTIQQRSKIDDTISMIEFSSYAFDLSSFTSAAQTTVLEPIQRPTSYLLHPDPKDPFFIKTPRKFRAELDDRLTSPLYCMLFALIPLLFLGQAQSTRQSRAPTITAAVLATVAIRIIPVFLPVQSSVLAEIALYLLPIALTIATIVLYLAGVQLRPPDSIVSFIERLFAAASGLVTRSGAATAAK
jgi:lipopolysaccharide export system permease protein